MGARLTGDSVRDVRLAAVLAIGLVSVEADAQTIALLGARLTDDSNRDVHLAALIASGQGSVRRDAHTVDPGAMKHHHLVPRRWHLVGHLRLGQCLGFVGVGPARHQNAPSGLHPRGVWLRESDSPSVFTGMAEG